MDEDLSRFADTLGALIERESRQVRERVRSFSESLQRFSERIGEMVSRISSEPGAATAAVTTPTGGVQLVRVVNTQSQPVFVSVLGESPQRQPRGGFFANLLGGIGGFFGGLLGGIVGGFVGGSGITLAVVVGELVAALGLAIPLVRQARRLVADVHSFALVLLRGIQSLVWLLFAELRAAGILPVSTLIASLLLLIDRGIVLVLTHVRPLIQWVGQLVETLANWVGEVLSSLSSWLGAVGNRFAAFLQGVLSHILSYVVRPFINQTARDMTQLLVGGMAGAALAMGRVLKETLLWGGEWIAYSIAQVLNKLPWVDINVARPEPLGERVGRAVEESFREGREFGRGFAETILPPFVGPIPVLPRLRMPGLRWPQLEVPEVPAPAPALEQLLEGAPPRPTRPPETVPAAVPAAFAAAGGGREVTLNGGIHVQITAETIDREHADDTARLIADQLLAELRRLTELGRFRQGLPTTRLT